MQIIESLIILKFTLPLKKLYVIILEFICFSHFYQRKIYLKFFLNSNILNCTSFNCTFNFLHIYAAFFGQTFDEIVVSSDLNVRRKSKENRQGKRLLSNVPSGTTGPPEKPTAIASRLVSTDGSRITLEKREKRGTVTARRR